jgi:hypothetical protein
MAGGEPLAAILGGEGHHVGDLLPLDIDELKKLSHVHREGASMATGDEDLVRRWRICGHFPWIYAHFASSG